VAAIIVAAGRGLRFGGDLPKQFLEVRGRSLVQRAVDAFAASPHVQDVVLVLPGDVAAHPEQAVTLPPAVRVVAGGERRQDSVAAGFDAVPAAAEVVLVHDAARPFVTASLIARAIAAAESHGAAIVALPARDTVKRGEPRGDAVQIVETIPRESVHLAQTPQAFRREILAEAVSIGRAGAEATDEAALAEAAGHPVVLVEGDPHNIKVTTPADLPIAAAIAAMREPLIASHVPSEALGGMRARTASMQPMLRVGVGYDSHRFGEGRQLVLGGVWIPHDRGLVGHSDADAVSHAVTDAILGAGNLGDIGRLFPDTDPRWKDADSLMMLGVAVARVHEAGYGVGNVDLVVICERPKIGPHAQAMRESLAHVLGVDPSMVSVKGKTNEGVDATGRGEALAVHAIATLIFKGGNARRIVHVPRPSRRRPVT
jgi:2-C-methyl-D-erythritol 4-phosphate cytidylyltransferase/2-C-methyl-D-erythritol 2,4-cyclodiphosphate synthase